MNIIAQLIGFIAFIVSLIAYHKDKKEKILGYMTLFNVLNLIHYFLLGAYTGCITKFLAIFRNVFVIFKEKNKKLNSRVFLYLFILVYIVVAIYSYGGIISILPLISSIIYIIAIWDGEELTIKRVAFFTYFLWLTYNIFVFSIPGVLSNVVSIISTFIAVENYKREQKVLKAES